MDSLIRVLMLEDNPDDAGLIELTLRRAEFKLETKIVFTRSDFVAALETFAPDVILSDHQLPQFNSPEALQISKAQFPDVPFILVTGAASEEFAASIIREGADDYLLKANLNRLPTAITMALEKKQTEESLRKSQQAERMAEQELQAAHRQLMFHIENSPLGYIEWDSQFRVKSWSRRAEEIFGWNEEELKGKEDVASFLVYEPDRIKARKNEEQLLSGELTQSNLQYRNCTKDGRVIWCEWFNSAMRNDSDDIIAVSSLVLDITERKTLEDILKEFNERYQILSKATNDAIWDWDIEHDFEIWNHGIQTIFGYPVREVSSSHVWWKDKIHPDDYERVTQEINALFTSKATNWVSRYQYKCADGSYKHVLDRGYILYQNDQPVRMIGAMQDITEQTESIKEIEKLSLVASKTNNAVMITDAESRTEWVNKGFEVLTGYTLNEVIGEYSGNLLKGEETDPSVLNRIAQKLTKRESFVEEIIHYSKTGRQYWARIDVSPVFDHENQLTHFISLETDISTQKTFENQITSIARELSNLIESANVPIFGIDRNGYINEWNLIAAELSGYTKDEVMARKWVQLIEPAHQKAVQTIIDKVLKGKPARNQELPLISKSGKRLIILLSISPRRDESKNIFGAICVGQDITEVVQYRQGLERIVEDRTRDLNEALQKEKELVELKSRFVAIASHEFRTPLSSISLVTGMLKKHGKDLPATAFLAKLETVEKQVLHMTYLLDDVLLIGKGDAGKIVAHYADVTIMDFFPQLAREVEQQAGTHKIVLSNNCTLKTFPSDEKLLRNIFLNLLTNAIKFSSYVKSVSFNISNTTDEIKFEVEDKGIGISPEDLAGIFTAFQRGSNVETIQGTGLGLSIAKKAVELLKGKIDVKSRIAKGTIFIVTLPLVK